MAMLVECTQKVKRWKNAAILFWGSPLRIFVYASFGAFFENAKIFAVTIAKQHFI